MPKQIAILLLLCIFIIPGQAWSDTILTQTDFIKQAVANNPSYQISAQDYLIALEQNKAVNSLEDWNLIISGLWNEANPAPISTFSSEYQKTTGYTVGLEKYIANTGTAIQLEHVNTKIEATYPPAAAAYNPPSKYYISNISLSIIQPLWKNAWGLAAKNALKMSAYSLKLAEIKLSEDWEDFIGLLRNEYSTWQKRQINVGLMENKVKTVADQLALVNKQVKVGLSEELDLVQMEQKLEGYKIMLEQANLACDTQTRKILQLMGQANSSISSTKPEPVKTNGQIMDETTATSYLVSSSNVKKTADILVELQTANLDTKEDAKKMDVSLVLSTKPNAFTEGFSDSISKIGAYSDNTITIKASRPLGNDKAEAEAEQAKLEKTKAEKQRENIMLNSSLGLATLYTNLQRLDNMIQLSQRNMKLAEQRLALEKKKFNQGRSSVFFVLQAEDDVLQAANSLNETVFAREAVINQIKTLTDRYLVEYKDILKI